MDTLQGELREDYPILKIQIVGINEFGQNPAGANELMTTGRTAPFLQDVDANANQMSDVWHESWGVTYRDVIIVDGQSEVVDVYNLTANDLGVSANHATLRDKLIDAAMTEQQPWQNHRDRYDIDDDGFVVPFDVLIMINDINDNGPRTLPPPTGTTLAAPYWDCSGDNFFSPVDVLQVINFIEAANAEGESSGAAAKELPPVAIPASDDETSASTELLDAETVNRSPEVATESALLSFAVQVERSMRERPEPIESASDEFWAEYRPSL